MLWNNYDSQGCRCLECAIIIRANKLKLNYNELKEIARLRGDKLKNKGIYDNILTKMNNLRNEIVKITNITNNNINFKIYQELTNLGNCFIEDIDFIVNSNVIVENSRFENKRQVFKNIINLILS